MNDGLNMTDSKKIDLEKKDSPLSKEDFSLWQEAMRDTKRQIEKPLSKSKKTITSTQKTKELSQEDKEAWAQFTESLKPSSMLPQSSLPKNDPQNIKEDIEKQATPPKKTIQMLNIDIPVDIDKRTFERLKKGRLPIDDSFDFHGIGIYEAHYQLIQLIEKWQENGKRCVLIITGKGSRTPKDQKTIRDAFPDWLNDPAVRNKILAYTKAQPKHGGSGAFYLLLRRKKKTLS